MEKGKGRWDRPEFEVALRREGDELREGEIKPNVERIAAPTVRAHPATSRQGCTKNIPKLTACDIWLGAMKPSRSIRLERLGSSDTQ